MKDKLGKYVISTFIQCYDSCKSRRDQVTINLPGANVVTGGIVGGARVDDSSVKITNRLCYKLYVSSVTSHILTCHLVVIPGISG